MDKAELEADLARFLDMQSYIKTALADCDTLINRVRAQLLLLDGNMPPAEIKKTLQSAADKTQPRYKVWINGETGEITREVDFIHAPDCLVERGRALLAEIAVAAASDEPAQAALAEGRDA